jgi:signal transduction histidine kinase
MEDAHPRDLNRHAATGRGYADRVFPALRAWLGAPPARVVDVALTVLVGVPTVASAVHSGVSQGRTAWGIVFGLAATLPLLVRRRWPFATLACIVTAAVLAPVTVAFEVPLIIALYTIGAHRSWEATIASSGAVVLTSLIYSLAGGPGVNTNDVIGIALLCAIASGAGLYIGSKRTSIATLEDQAAQLTREREILAEAAVAEERVRIAQELHDVVAHNVSLIVVQAQALGATSGDPAVSAATDGIADLGRSTMAEMHRTLRLLRSDGEAADLTPQPGLADLPDLVSRSRDAGLRVDLAIEGAPRSLAQSVDLSAFRIVQEALTNVFRHAGRADTSVTVVYGPRALELTILDRGHGDPVPGAATTPGGHGLIGMRERTALFGGTLSAGPRPGAGFEVKASLPYDEGLA